MMLLPQLTFNHFGWAIGNDTDALVFLKALGYSVGERSHDPIQNVLVRLCKSPIHPTVELVQPPGKHKSPIDSILSHHGEMIYHTCYETPDLEATLIAMKAIGLRCIPLTKRQPAILFDGRYVSFYKIKGWGIVELLES
jgi:hypothetical protein